MLLTINGENKNFEPVRNIPDLLARLKLGQDRIAVEVNGRIIRRAEWDSTAPAEGDRIEIVQFVGGG